MYYKIVDSTENRRGAESSNIGMMVSMGVNDNWSGNRGCEKGSSCIATSEAKSVDEGSEDSGGITMEREDTDGEDWDWDWAWA
jgi:hypothetical protein